jgi:hypothetical protein
MAAGAAAGAAVSYRAASYRQGGLEPSWHTTVVPELGGTTTVVFFCGGGALLLLMHAERLTSMHSEANTIFMILLPVGWLRGHFDGLRVACLSSTPGTDGQCHPTFAAVG